MIPKIADHFQKFSSSSVASMEGNPETGMFTSKAKTSVGRTGFLLGSLWAVVLTVKAIVLSILGLLANVLTLFYFEKCRTFLWEQMNDIPPNFLAIFIGCAGILFPETIQELVLDIPTDEQGDGSGVFQNRTGINFQNL